MSGDFGEVGQMEPGSLDENSEVPHSDGFAMNALAVIGGEDRIMSIYPLSGGVVWIETVADLSYTTLYFAGEPQVGPHTTTVRPAAPHPAASLGRRGLLAMYFRRSQSCGSEWYVPAGPRAPGCGSPSHI